MADKTKQEKQIEYQREYYQKNRESILIKMKEYNQKIKFNNLNKPKEFPTKPSYYQRNKAYCIMRAKKYYQLNKAKSMKSCVALKRAGIEEKLAKLQKKKEAFIAKLAQEQLTNNNIELV